MWLGIHDTAEMIKTNLTDHMFLVEKVIIHEEYDDIYFDVCLLKLKNRVAFTEEKLPICLPLGRSFPDSSDQVGDLQTRSEITSISLLRNKSSSAGLRRWVGCQVQPRLCDQLQGPIQEVGLSLPLPVPQRDS